MPFVIGSGKRGSDFILEHFNDDRAMMVFLRKLEEACEVLWGKEFVQSLLGYVCVNG